MSNFATLTDSPEKTAAGIPPKRRRHFRSHCLKDATLRVNGSRIPSQVRDSSPAGVCLEVEKNHRLLLGEKVALDWSVDEVDGSALSRHCLIGGIVVRIGKEEGVSQAYGIKFQRLINEQLALESSRLQKIVVTCVAAALAGWIGFLKFNHLVYFWYEPWVQTYSLGAAAFVLSRVILSFFYREPSDQAYFPTISIVIAAKNEQAHIAETVHHCFRAHYPPDLFDVIAIDDGSMDNTWEVMETLRSQYPRLNIFRFEKNKGKRHAMALGAQKAKGEILVYVDSDSYIDSESLYRIVQPFRDRNIGAVSGHVLVAIEQDNFISKMEAVRYYVSHRVMKAAESVFGAVTCCPGAFSAYRRSAVLEVIPSWLNQTFWGTPATFGDDRSLTNYILRNDQVIYHAGAVCLTYTPRTWLQFLRQQLRWKKSWARETTIAVRLMYRKHPVAALAYYMGVVITLISPLVAFRALVVLPLLTSASLLPYLVGVFLVYLFLCLIYLYHTRSRCWYYGLAFAGLYICILSLQNYYAIATMRKNHWGTR
jgi:hyaluronan synthase